MVRLLQHVSAFFFYLLGASFFAAYVLLKQKMYADVAALWMQTADLPFAFSALAYGGLSLYLSMHGDTSKKLAWLITIPLALVFGAIVVLNFLPA